MSRSNAGFTLVELVTTIILVGIISVAALPRVTNNADFSGRAFYDAVWSAVTHARRLAVSGRRFACVTITAGIGAAGTVRIQRDTNDPDAVTNVACGINVLPPGQKSCPANPSALCAPDGVAITDSLNLVFNPRGQLVSSGAPNTVVADNAVIRIANQLDITVRPQTGFVQ